MHAKNTVDITYIARAETHGAEVRPLHLADARSPRRAPAATGASASATSATATTATVEAPMVVLAAGTLGSTRLLLQNRRRLPGLSPALGSALLRQRRRARASRSTRARPTSQGARNDYGPVMTSRLDYTADRRLIVADGGLPANFDVLLDVARGVNVIRGWRRWLLRLRHAARARSGSATSRCARATSRLRERRADTDSLIFLMIGRDAADGRMRLTPLFRRFDIRWSKAGSAQLFADLERTAQRARARRPRRRRSTRSRAGR